MDINNPNDDDAANFKDAMVALGFRQHILFPTQNSGNTLDLIFMEEYSNIKVRTCRKCSFISDHCFITCTTTLAKPDIAHKLVKYRNLKDINAELMTADIKLDYYEDILFSSLVHQFDTTLTEGLDKHASIQCKSIAERKCVPWFTPDVKEAKKKMHCREKLWRKYHMHELWLAFKDARRSYKASIKQAKRGFLNKQVSDCGRNSKKLYALMSSLMGIVQSNPPSECDSFDTLAENFADFFHTKIKKIRDNLDHFPKYTPQHKDIPILDRFCPTFSHEGLQVIMNMLTK